MKKLLEHKLTLPAILLLAMILRLIPAISAAAEPERLLRPDSEGYLIPAMALAESGTYPTTIRPPGYPLLAAAVYAAGGNNCVLALLQVLISTASCFLTFAAAREYAGKAAGNLAALLMALNLTAIANTPLLLSDTLFALFAAGEFYLFIRYRNSGKLHFLLAATATAASAVLIRPINQLIILPMVTLTLIIPAIPWKQKAIHCLWAVLLFTAIITPWMLRNYLAGATFDIDTNTGAMRHQNGAMLMAKINHTDFESEKQKLLEIENQKFPPGSNFSGREKEQWRKAEFRKMVMEHPFTYFFQHFDLHVLLPDAPTLMENFGTTSPNRGTMGVLKKDGIFAALKHYFGENWLIQVLFILPLILPVLLLYLGDLAAIAGNIRNLKTAYPELLLFLAFAEYYLFLPGAITAPRYQLPALPCLCTIAAAAIIKYYRIWRKDESTAQITGNMEV